MYTKEFNYAYVNITQFNYITVRIKLIIIYYHS